MRTWLTICAIQLGFLCGMASAADIGVTAKKLIIVDKIASAGRGKVVFVSADGAITKGAGTDPAAIDVALDIDYIGVDGTSGAQFAGPAGAFAGAAGWAKNTDTVAKFVNKDAPSGSTETKVAIIKPAKLLKLVGKGVGDTPIDLPSAGTPLHVTARFTVDNGGETNRHCTQFSTCKFKEIAGGTGRKLVCKEGVPDPDCNGNEIPPVNCLAESGCFCDLGLTVVDTCTGLEWVKHIDCGPTNVFCTADPTYCSLPVCLENLYEIIDPINPNVLISYMFQLDGFASALHPTWTGGLVGPGNSCYADHCDWDYPTADQLLTIWGPCGGISDPCIDPIFGPTQNDNVVSGQGLYWTRTVAGPDDLMVVDFGTFSSPTPLSANLSIGLFANIRAVRTVD